MLSSSAIISSIFLLLLLLIILFCIYMEVLVMVDKFSKET